MDTPSPNLGLPKREEITCPQCNNIYTNPKQLPCLHVLCLECLNNLVITASAQDKIKCPLCQIEVHVSDSGSMENLPNCLHVKNLLDILTFKEHQASSATCTNCDQTFEEASYCFHCDRFWCQGCLNAHNVLKENKLHRVLALKEIGYFEDVLKGSVTPVAGPSSVQKDHSSEEMTAILNDISRRLDASREPSRKITSCIRVLEENTRLLDYRSRTNKEHIQRTVNSLILTLQQKEQELVAEVENQTVKAKELLEKSKGELQEQLKKREQFVSQIEALIQRSTSAGFLPSTKLLIDELFEGLQELEDPDMLSTTEWKSLTMFAKNKEIFQSLQILGIGNLVTTKTTTEANQCSVKWFQTATAGLEAEIEVITRNSQGKQCYCPGDYINLQLISTQDRDIVTETKITDSTDGSYKISFIPIEGGHHLPTIQVNGEAVGGFPPLLIKERSFLPVRAIAETADGVVKTQSLAGQASRPRSRVKEDDTLKQPWGVTVTDKSEIFVTDLQSNRIVIFNEAGKFIRSFGHKLAKNPTGICINSEGMIFVANRGNDKILLFNSKGEYVTTVHNGGLLKQPRGISLDAQGNILVCDTGNKCVRFLSPNGSILKTIGKGGLHFPFDCLCYNNKVFVSDRDAQLVKVFSRNNGRILYEFGGKSLGDPLGLAVDKTGHLLVSGILSNSHRVYVFTLDGKFVTKYGGSFGGELGQLNTPTSVSVLTNGRIVVCDCRNSRLQVFA